MSILKKEGMAWTTITDTDEYILPNNQAKGRFDRLKHISWNKTILEMIQENRKTHYMLKLGCISMHRIQFGLQEFFQQNLLQICQDIGRRDAS